MVKNDLYLYDKDKFGVIRHFLLGEDVHFI